MLMVRHWATVGEIVSLSTWSLNQTVEAWQVDDAFEDPRDYEGRTEVQLSRARLCL
jgi:hypothetical protein